jgi:hypothetical protein
MLLEVLDRLEGREHSFDLFYWGQQRGGTAIMQTFLVGLKGEGGRKFS